MAATEGPVLSPGPTQPALQQPLGLTASNLPAHPTETPASKGVTSSFLTTSHLPESSSHPLSLQTPTHGMVSVARETIKVTVTFPESPNITVSSWSPPGPRFPLMTKAVTVSGHSSWPVRTTSLQPSLPASPSSRPVDSPGVTFRAPTASGSHKAFQTPAVTKVMKKTGVPQAQNVSSPSSPLVMVSTTVEPAPLSPLATQGMEVVPSTKQGEPEHSHLMSLPVSPHPSTVSTALPRPARHTTTATGPPALSPQTLAATSLSTVAHGLGATALMSLELTRPSQLLSGLPPDTSLPLAKVGTSAPVATPGSKGSDITFLLQHQATSLAVATTPPAQTLGTAVSPTPAMVAQVQLSSSPAPQVTGTTPDLLLGDTLSTSGVVTMVTGTVPTESVAPRKSTSQKMAILSKQVSLPTSTYGSAQGKSTELTPTVAPLVTEVEGPQARTVPLVPTSYPLSRVSARTASRESSLVLLPQLAEAHGTSAGLQPPAEPVGEATTEQSGRSAPAQSIAEGSAGALAITTEANTSATCVVSDVRVSHLSVDSPSMPSPPPHTPGATGLDTTIHSHPQAS
jgi:hypothetical protein